MGVPPSIFLDQEDPPQQQQFQSVQPPPEPAPAYEPGTDLFGTDLATGQPIRVPAKHVNRLKAMLLNGFHAMGESLLNSAGVETDEQKAERAARLRLIQSQGDEIAQRTAMMNSMVMLPNGVQVPHALALKLYPEMVKGEYGLAKTGVASRYRSTPMGLFDTQTSQMVSGSGPDGVTITPEIAGDNPALQQFIGKKVKWSDYNGATRAQAIGSGFVMGADGPVAANKITGQATPVTVNGKGIGNPGVATAEARARANARYGIAITDEGETISRLDALQQGIKLASGNPILTKGLKPYEDAFAADARLKQMQMQSQDQTGASDMALLFNHIAMTGGSVKGMSMGEHLTSEHMKARSIPEELGVLYNKVVDGQKLSPEQRQNFLRLAREVRQTTWQKAAQEGKAYGVDPSFLEQDPELDKIDLSGYAPKTRLTPRTGGVRQPSKSSTSGNWFAQHGGVKK